MGQSQGSLQNLALAIYAVADRLEAIDLDLAKCVLEVICGLIVPPRIAAPIEDSDTFDARHILAGQQRLERESLRHEMALLNGLPSHGAMWADVHDVGIAGVRSDGVEKR